MDKKFLLDGHVHTLACGHAYNTITEMAKAAKDLGLEMILWNEHGPKLPNGTNYSFFSNRHSVPPVVEGVQVLKGIEADILEEGKLRSKGFVVPHLDIYKNLADRLEFVSASLHQATFKPKSLAENTEAVLEAANTDIVDFLCHLGNANYPIDQERVIKEIAKNNKMVEINNGSFLIRKGSVENCANIAKLCKKYDVPVIVGTDAHFADAVGKFPYAQKLLETVDFPEELIINYEPERLVEYLESKGKKVGVPRDKDADELLKKIEEVAGA